MKTKALKLQIETMHDFKNKVRKELRAIDKGKKSLGGDSVSFQSLDQLRSFLTPKRLELIRAIKHSKPKSIYDLAKKVSRTPENVNQDIALLERLGLIETTISKDTRKRRIPRIEYDRMTLEIEV